MGVGTFHWRSRRRCSTLLLLAFLVYVSLWTFSSVVWSSNGTGSDAVVVSRDLSHQYFADQSGNDGPGDRNAGMLGSAFLQKISGYHGTDGQSVRYEIFRNVVVPGFGGGCEDDVLEEKYRKHARVFKSSRRNTSQISKDATMASSGVNQRRSDLENIRKYFTVRKNMTNSFANLHRYYFPLKPTKCSRKAGLEIIILVHSAVSHFQNRQIIRRALDVKRTRNGIQFYLLFLLGQTLNTSLHRKLSAESETYSDILQGNFTDSYQNMTYKHIMGYHWVVHYCSHVNYVIKIDDDVIVNVQNVVKYISTKKIKTGRIACSAHLKSKVKTFGKWLPRKNQFPFNHYPPYCSGFAYLAPMSVIQRLYEASASVRMYWIDDVYVTGLLTLATNTTIVGLTNMEAYKHIVKSPIPKFIMKKALFIFNDPGYTYGRSS
ncbi:beta-1,3-galactosyltransferase 1-like [Haliotis asinina]|uniref:beta-1,3-galactosyltransferase 1-like n=1 Tax=Haliotis asinina TaxID=109174 RepID=UPI003532093B